MKYISRDDTIVALSTPMGSGAIAVVRLSGAQSLDILNPLLKRTITPEHARQAVFNELRGTENGASLDQVVTTFFQSRSHTPAKIWWKSVAIAIR